jgi:hypothetical protein
VAAAARSPVDRVRTGSKHHLITDGTGIPLACALTGGKRNDVTQLIPLLEAVPPVRPRHRPLIARRNTEHGSGLGTHRWVGDRESLRALAPLPPAADRWQSRDDVHQALLSLGCALICWRRLASMC